MVSERRFVMTSREAAENILNGMLKMMKYYDEWACEREFDTVAILAAGLRSAIDEGAYG